MLWIRRAVTYHQRLTPHVCPSQIVINCSGRGDKDVNTVAKALGLDI